VAFFFFGGGGGVVGWVLHSSTSLLNLSRVCHTNTPYTPYTPP
jgi:hypothetical protein